MRPGLASRRARRRSKDLPVIALAFADSLDAARRRDQAVPGHRGVFPVVDLQGWPTGVVRLDDLVRVPPADRRTVAIRRVARPCAPE
jgi:hypothetical protein